jgi:hypothetical protein
MPRRIKAADQDRSKFTRSWARWAHMPAALVEPPALHRDHASAVHRGRSLRVLELQGSASVG